MPMSSYWVMHNLSGVECPIWVAVLIAAVLAGLLGLLVYDMITWDK